jgi:RHS repeat-associated protein
LRDESKVLRWYEQHYAFGESINEETLNGDIVAGSGNYQISWSPSFRFPGQYEDQDMGLSAIPGSLFIQNHYREYIPGLGRYNRLDPKIMFANISNYPYVQNNPFIFTDPDGGQPIIKIIIFGCVILIVAIVVLYPPYEHYKQQTPQQEQCKPDNKPYANDTWHYIDDPCKPCYKDEFGLHGGTSFVCEPGPPSEDCNQSCHE